MKTMPINLRVPVETIERIKVAAKKTGLTQADVVRAAIELGLPGLMLVRKSPLERIKEEIAETKRSESFENPQAENKRRA